MCFVGDRGAAGQSAAHEQPKAGELGDVGSGGGGGGQCFEGSEEEEAGLLLNHVKAEPGRGDNATSNVGQTHVTGLYAYTMPIQCTPSE